MIDDSSNFDEIEELESLEASKINTELTKGKSANFSLMSLPFLQHLAASFEQSTFPFAIIDKDSFILYKNDAFYKTLLRFKLHNIDNFSIIGSKSVIDDDKERFFHYYNTSSRQHSFKMHLRLKSRDTVQSLLQAFIFPLVPEGAINKTPEAFTIFFDNITNDNQKILRSMFLSLLEASKMKDNDTGLHVERVNQYARVLAGRMYNKPEYPEIDMDFLNDIGFLAAMHDVGKIGTPDDILNKKGALSTWEWTIMREHTINGAFILSTYPNIMARQIAIGHHEMWNGSGYPYKLSGKMIPLAARIVSLCDVYDALRMKRSYKEALSHDVAIEKILEWKNTHFDPEIIDIFLLVEKEFEMIFDKNQDKEVNQHENREEDPTNVSIPL